VRTRQRRRGQPVRGSTTGRNPPIAILDVSNIETYDVRREALAATIAE
jgi:hypothetical protein